jgi:hypothetical protein
MVVCTRHPSYREASVGGLWSKASLRQKITEAKKSWDVAQGADSLHSKHEVLSTNTSTAPK